MRRTWLGVRSVNGAGSAWLAMAVAIGGWRCSVDDRSPKEREVSSEMPTGNGSDGARFSKVPNGGAAGSGALEQTSGAAGAAGMGSGGAAGGMEGGAAGAGMAGSAATGGSAGSSGRSAPPGAGGTPSGDLPDDPFGGLGDLGAPGGESNTGSNNSACPSFDACGGALDGTWTYSNVCIAASENSADLLLEVCPTASVMYERGDVATLTFTGSSVTRTGEPLGDSVITFPAECVEGLGCSFLAGALGTSASCTDRAGDCICRAASSVDWSTQSYTTTGGRLALGDGRSFDYCVQGDTLTYRETGDVQEPGTHTLTRN